MGSLIPYFVLLYMEPGNYKTATHDCFVGYQRLTHDRRYKVHTQLIRKTAERVTRGRVLAVGQWATGHKKLTVCYG